MPKLSILFPSVRLSVCPKVSTHLNNSTIICKIYCYLLLQFKMLNLNAIFIGEQQVIFALVICYYHSHHSHDMVCRINQMSSVTRIIIHNNFRFFKLLCNSKDNMMIEIRNFCRKIFYFQLQLLHQCDSINYSREKYTLSFRKNYF
jgi:hypothetical protein